MTEQEFVNPRILDFDYYVNKLPLYLQSSHGFTSHFKIWFDLLAGTSETNGLVGAWNTTMNLLDIFNPDYLTNLATLPDYTPYTCDMLDKLAELFGVRRQFSVTYIDGGSSVTDTLNLTNAELLLLIKARIINNNFDGSREQIEEYYNSAGLRIFSVTNDEFSANCKLILVQIGSQYTNNILALFKAGLLHIPSMGINYEYEVQTITGAMYWDSGTITSWDVGEWDV